ncbi:MAG: amidohydrolase family protein [Acidobacteria bacterium]|nr:amidohydrolase family protein [Acidobacteriota bacterium]
MKRNIIVGVSLGVLLALLPAARSETLVIEGGTLIDGRGGAPVENAVVVMDGGRIKAVGTKGNVAYPASARVITQTGRTILPGLIDSHIHFREWYPPMFLHYGVTTVYDTANPTDWIIAQRELVNRGKIKGPRMFVTGIAIDGPPERSVPHSGAELGGYNTHVTTVEEAREAVRKNVAAGVDIIKVHEGLTSELLKTVVEEAKKSGRPVVGHSEDIREATLVGLQFMEHTTPLAHAIIKAEDEHKLEQLEKQKELEGSEYLMNPGSYDPLIKLMVSKGVFINATLIGQWGPANPRGPEWAEVAAAESKKPGIEFVPADVRQSWTRPARKPDPKHAQEVAQGFKKVQEFVGQYAKAGGRLTAGTDTTGYVPGLSLSFEMQSLIDCGATNMQALMAATKWAAELAHKQKDLGTIEPGKIADIMVVDGDPLKDISAIRKVVMVVKDGQVIDSALDPHFVNPIPRTALNGQLKGPDNGPELSTVTPGMVTEGSKDITLQITGKRFTPKSIARLNDTELKTQFVSDSQLKAVVSAANLQKVGSYVVTVVDPDSRVKSNLRWLIVNFKY